MLELLLVSRFGEADPIQAWFIAKRQGQLQGSSFAIPLLIKDSCVTLGDPDPDMRNHDLVLNLSIGK